MDTRRLEVFCRVVELKSFSRAAEAVLLSQPTVSEHVRILEESFGGRLLDRMGREVLPTPAGEVVYRHARRILQQVEEAFQAVEEFRGTLSGNLTVGASTIPGAYILPSLVEGFKAQNPAIQITLKIAGTSQVVSRLLEGELEMALIGAPWKEPGVTVREMFSDELLLVVPPGHPWTGRKSIPPEELYQHPFLLREPGSGTRQIMADALRRTGVDPSRLQAIAEMGSTEAVRQGVKARLGVTIISSLAVQEDLAAENLVAVTVDRLRMVRPFYLALRRNRELSPVAQSFLNHLVGHAPPPIETLITESTL